MSSLDSVFRLIVNHCHRIWSLTRAKGLDTLYFHQGGMATAVGAAHPTRKSYLAHEDTQYRKAEVKSQKSKVLWNKLFNGLLISAVLYSIPKKSHNQLSKDLFPAPYNATIYQKSKEIVKSRVPS